MGGFVQTASTFQPGLAQEPIQGDSLTQYLRSLTNFAGGASQPFLGGGAGLINSGAAAAGGPGLGQLQTAFGTTQPAVDYWNAILSGDPKALTAATAPTANALSAIYGGATNNASTGLPAGGFRSATLAQLPQQQAAQVGNYLLGLQPVAAQNLNALAGTQAGIGSGTVGAGLGIGSLGLGTAGIGSQLLQQALNALLGRRGQNVQQDISNLGDLTQGLTTLASGGSTAGTAAIMKSDIDLKAGLLPLGVVDGVNVYAWRYKDTGELAMGVIAQEVEQVVPEAVSRGRDGYLRVDYDRLFRTLRLKEAA